jgi:hypothetical protein
MDLISLFVIIIVFGLIFYCVQALMPIPQPFKNVALVIVVLFFILFLLDRVGYLHLRV